jgi:hypothetical protein
MPREVLRMYDISEAVMTETPNQTTSTATAVAGYGAPNWDNVPFDVGCARCGEDLRGLTEPRCPACTLEFDWADAVPIEELICESCGYHLYGLRETRCPECGQPFDWEDALAAHYRRKKPLFEYRWLQHPVRSFVRSWRLAMYPSRLWRTVDLHDPPQTRPLLLTVLATVVALFILTPMLTGLEEWAAQRSMRWRAAPVTHADMPVYLIQAGFTNPASYRFPAYILTWAIVSGAALLVLRQSMRRHRVRTIHVLRVWVYTAMSLLPLAPLFKYVGGYTEVYVKLRMGRMEFPEVEPYALIPLMLAAVWFVRQGYRHYLKIPHGLAVAITTQIIALLAVPALFYGMPRLLGYQ